MEPFSNHLQIKSCPAERQIAWCIGLVHRALTGISDVLFCAEIIEFQFSFWLRASGLYSGRMLALKPVKLCQSWIQAPHVCRAAMFFCVWVNCGSGGILAPPRTWMHIYMLSVSPRTSLCLCFLSTKNSHTRRPVVYNHLTAALCASVEVLPLLPRLSEASRKSPRACQAKAVIGSIFAAETFMCHCFTHSHTPTCDVWKKSLPCQALFQQ